MNLITLIIGGMLALFLLTFMLRLFYIIAVNLIKGRKFHHSLEREFDRIRLSRMLAALGINKAQYIHNTRVVDIKQQMDSCNKCGNTDECDSKLTHGDIKIDTINFCNNEASLKEIKQNQAPIQE